MQACHFDTPQDIFPVERDPTLYYASGDCVIRVQQTLFKIHRFQLTNNSPVFDALFSLPVGEISLVEGSSDELPIVLDGDTASDFSSLLKFIYAPVISTQIRAISASELPHVVAVARLAHKYDMEPWQTWAFLVFASHYRTPAVSKQLSSSDIATIYKVCDRPQGLTLRNEMADLWLRRIESDPALLSAALDAAESESDERFLTRLYALHLARTDTLSTLGSPTPFPTEGIPAVHLPRMLTGYWSLSTSYAQLRASPPHFPPYLAYCSIGEHEKCLRTWKSSWEEALTSAECEHPSVCAMDARLERVKRALADGVQRWTCYDAFIGNGEPVQKIVDDFKLQNHFFPVTVEAG
ncbi:hypothetical protein FB45DRAFT_1006916 [Roridomyces roridus]|uniref:BTB domain-containing protein n=1 Tax=Roridomyces roridus TaxID=1738132 RepID=A0AAD7BGV6_9AGAR|nr:hypothetical protein FB45DRAFT_1006916 [Roridomyces roridus]